MKRDEAAHQRRPQCMACRSCHPLDLPGVNRPLAHQWGYLDSLSGSQIVGDFQAKGSLRSGEAVLNMFKDMVSTPFSLHDTNL